MAPTKLKRCGESLIYMIMAAVGLALAASACTGPLPVSPGEDGGAPASLADGGDPPSEPDDDDADPQEPDAATEPTEDLGVGDGQDVVTLGDSYMRLPNALQQPGAEGVELSLEEASGQSYRKFGYTGGSVLPPVPVAVLNGVIPGQLERALADDPEILTVVITAGGNDLNDSCNGPTTVAELSDACKALVEDIEAGTQGLVADMAAAGVEDVIWVGYGDTATTGDRVFRGALDYMRELRLAACVADDPALGLRCHYVDNKGREGLATRDGFHPDAAGYDLLGQVVWERMQTEGVRR